MIATTKNFSKLVNAGKRKKPKNKEPKHLGEMPAVDTLGEVTKGKKKRKK